jgi:hypothetical protein
MQQILLTLRTYPVISNKVHAQVRSVLVEVVCSFDLKECNLYLFISSHSLTVFTRIDMGSSWS